MNFLDIIILIILAFMGFKGFKRGLIIEMASILALILGIYGAIEFSFYVEGLLKDQTNLDESYLPLAAFAVTFLGIVVGIHLLARVIQGVLKMAALGLINRIAGAVFGLLKATIIMSFILVFLNSSLLGGLPKETKSESYLYGPVASVGPTIMPIITKSSWYRDLDLTGEFDDAKEKVEEETNL
ncbi:CvpA family protein [Salibacter sp.]|uniref:CvpA family protein n=1 Tax=Salibacter sp. TaxID=2010995 RepID=UPI00287087BC|nr:CvpA family protein [Salibacter sp.]MDR9487559.1 CvpA family protein [Salibacter sp.]